MNNTYDYFIYTLIIVQNPEEAAPLTAGADAFDGYHPNQRYIDFGQYWLFTWENPSYWRTYYPYTNFTLADTKEKYYGR